MFLGLIPRSSSSLETAPPRRFRFTAIGLNTRALWRHADHAPFAQHLESKGSGGRDCFNKSHLDAVTELEGGARFLADQGLTNLVMIVELAPDRGGGDEAVGAGLLQPDKEPGAHHAGHARLEVRPDPIGKKSGARCLR
jgi:hypothetical protein